MYFIWEQFLDGSGQRNESLSFFQAKPLHRKFAFAYNTLFIVVKL